MGVFLERRNLIFVLMLSMCSVDFLLLGVELPNRGTQGRCRPGNAVRPGCKGRDGVAFQSGEKILGQLNFFYQNTIPARTLILLLSRLSAPPEQLLYKETAFLHSIMYYSNLTNHC